ncbi:MAG: PEP-CTERM sorting domain-containing protein [Puniceicoccales bacterium]
MNQKKQLSLAVLALAGAAANAALTPESGYVSGSVLDSQGISAYDIYDSGGAKAYGWNGSSTTLRQYDVTTGLQLNDLGAPPGGYASGAFVSFVRRSPDGNSVWVGFTVGGNSDDRIYEVTDLAGTPTWNERATVTGNYDLEFFGSDAFVSADPDAPSFGANNSIYYLDAGDAYNPIEFADVDGYSSALAFNDAGDLVYGTSGLTENELVSFASADIVAFLNNPAVWNPLSRGDATLLSDLPAGSSGLWADAFGGIFVGVTAFLPDFSSEGSLYQWSGLSGIGENLELLASTGSFLGSLDGLGELSNGGVLFASAGGPGISTLEVPEPSTYAALAGAMALGCALWRRRR